MKPYRAVHIFLIPVLGFVVSCSAPPHRESVPRQAAKAPPEMEMAQVASWSKNDLDFFLHGSMGTEVVPEAVLRAFIGIYPDLFAARDLSNFGLIPDSAFGWPIGFSRNRVSHLGGLSSVGINCAACHVGEVLAGKGGKPFRVLGMTSHFDVEAFFGGVIVATFRSSDPANLKAFLEAFLAESDPPSSRDAQEALRRTWENQKQAIIASLKADPGGSVGIEAGALHSIGPSDVRIDARSLADGQDLAMLSHSIMKVFHNMRAALHVGDRPPESTPPASGPGRNDAFGLLSAVGAKPDGRVGGITLLRSSERGSRRCSGG